MIIYKFKRKILPNCFDDYFENFLPTHNYPTRHALSDNYIAARFDKSSSQRSIRYIGTKSWNELHALIEGAQINIYCIFSKKNHKCLYDNQS